jgi:hypothetical protein
MIDPCDGYAKLTRRAHTNLLSRLTRTLIPLSLRYNNNQGMVPLSRYLPMSYSITYSDLPVSSICLPQVSKDLGNLKLYLDPLELCILCTICKYTLYPDSVIWHISKHKVPLRDYTALTSVV